MQNLPLSYLEISKENLIHNVMEFRNFLRKDTLISAVIKSNAYGHGDIEVIKILSPYVDYFQVNSILELEKIRKISKKPVFVFGYVGKNDLEKAIKLGCILTAFDLAHLILINKIAEKLNKKQKVHIAIDAHLGREGVMPVEVEKLVKNLFKLNNIILDGIYAHFANIEDTMDFSHAQKQIDAYKNTIEIFKKYGFDKLKTHISATSGVMVYENKESTNNIVRIGIGMYGLWPSLYLENKFKNKINLKPVLTWKTHIAQVKTLPAGHSVGYGLSYITKKETKIAVIPQGYADGYDRGFSNIGEVLIAGKKCKILGRVAMNMFVVDVNNLKNIKTGDEVILLGQQGKNKITAEDLAKKIDTINYEITTRISPLLLRIII